MNTQEIYDYAIGGEDSPEPMLACRTLEQAIERAEKLQTALDFPLRIFRRRRIRWERVEP